MAGLNKCNKSLRAAPYFTSTDCSRQAEVSWEVFHVLALQRLTGEKVNAALNEGPVAEANLDEPCAHAKGLGCKRLPFTTWFRTHPFLMNLHTIGGMSPAAAGPFASLLNENMLSQRNCGPESQLLNDIAAPL